MKQDRAFPLRAVSYCLDAAGIERLDLEAIHVGWPPRFYLQKSDRTQVEAFRERGRISYLALNELATLLEGEIQDVRRQLVTEAGRLEIRFVDHHRAHLANAFRQSGFETADFLILDGFGELSTGLCGVVAPCATTVLASLRTPHSLGSLYSICNGKLLAHTPYQELFAGGSRDDTGISVGSAFEGAAEAGWELPHTRARHNFFGRAYDRAEIQAALERRRISFRTVADPAAEAAARLAQRQVIGWFDGGSELGQRALGHRSILADPTRAETKAHVNETVKYRESFRPFAAAALAERRAELFPGLDGQNSDFMERVFPFDPKWAERLPAVVHTDGSGRLQTVDSRVHPHLHALIREFERRTGAPAVLNTSFDTDGVPLVETPGDAIRCFFDSGLDALLLGDFLVEKSAGRGSV